MSTREEKLSILKVEAGKAPFVKEIPYTLWHLQHEVGGLIEVIELGMDCLVILNEEGKLNSLPPNRRLGDDIICGDFFICAKGGENFKSLNEAQIMAATEFFTEIPTFTGKEPEIEPKADVFMIDADGNIII